MTEGNNFEKPFQNNNKDAPNKNKIKKSYKNNNLLPYQTKIQEPYKNNSARPFQDNNSESSENENYHDYLQQEILEETEKKMKDLKIKYCTIMIIMFLSEIVLELIALSILSKDIEKKYDDEGSNFGEGLIIAFLLFIIYPALIILSSIILCCSCQNNCPTAKIIIFAILCTIRGLIMLTFFNEDCSSIKIFGIVLEILNFFYMITSISYQVNIQHNLYN